MKALHPFSCWLLVGVCLLSAPALAREDASAHDSPPLATQVENLKAAALELERDLRILEEELLFPATTQVVVFVSLNASQHVRLDSVSLQINEELVASHIYTDRQNYALSRGGVQRLYMGNLEPGEHELTAMFTGVGPDNQEYKRTATTTVEKGKQPMMLELRIQDPAASMQPEFAFEEWQL